TIVANSVSGGDVFNNFFTTLQGGHNLIETAVAGQGTNSLTNTIMLDPLLGPLASNGGPTQTMALLPGSPAIDVGSNSSIPAGVTTDQRGSPRISGAAVDIGAFEFVDTPPTIASTLTGMTVDEGSQITNDGTFYDIDGRNTVTLTASVGTVTKN